MRSSVSLVGIVLLIAGCHDGSIAPESFASACPLTAPVRLAAVPEGWQPRPGRRYPFRALGDRLVYSFDEFDDPDPAYWLVHRCGGEPERFESFVPGSILPFALETEVGTLVYAVDADGRHVLVDRLDVPGFDSPRPIAGLPRFAGSGGAPHDDGYALFAHQNPATSTAMRAAGVGAATLAAYTHDGDLDASALSLGDAVVDLVARPGRLLLLDDDGVLRQHDPFARTTDVLLTNVRYFTLAADDRHLIWQALGNDLAEPVFLRDLDVSARSATHTFALDREVAVNDFAAESWNRRPDGGLDVGTWSFTGDSATAALIGPDNRFVAVIATDTGASREIPEHIGHRGAVGPEFILVLPDPDDHVLALWDPRAKSVRIWYRGPRDSAPELRGRDGDHLEYFLPDPVDPALGSLWRVDLATGQTDARIRRIGREFERIDEDRYFTAFRAEAIRLGTDVSWTYDLAVIHAGTGVYRTLAEGVDDYLRLPDQGILYMDVRGPEPGLWIAPVSSSL